MKNLPKKPATGGIPVMENMNAVNTAAIGALVLPSPARSSIPSTIRPWLRMQRMQAKVPTFMNT